MHAGSAHPFLRTLHIVAWAIQEHLGATSCACDGGIINKPRQEVEDALRAIDPHAHIEEVNHAGTPLVVYSGSNPGAGEYTFAVRAESMVRAELRQRPSWETFRHGVSVRQALQLPDDELIRLDANGETRVINHVSIIPLARGVEPPDTLGRRLPDAALRQRLRTVVAWNMGALMTSAAGLGMVAVGILLG